MDSNKNNFYANLLIPFTGNVEAAPHKNEAVL